MKLFIAALLAFISVGAHAQSESAVQVEYRFGLLTEATHQPNIVNQFGVSGFGTSAEHTIRACYEHNIISLSDDVSFDGSIGAQYGIGNFTSDNFPSNPVSTDFTLQSNTLSAYLRAGFSDMISSAIILGISGWLAVPVAETLNESVVTNGASTTYATNSAISYSRIPAGIRLDVNYSKPWSNNAPITFALFGELDLDAYRQMGMKATSAGISFRWNFPPFWAGSIIKP